MQVTQNYIFIGILLICLFLITNCSDEFKNIDFDINKTLIWQGSLVKIHFTTLKNPVISGKTYIHLYGNLELSNYDKGTKSVNLNCLSISIENSTSEQVYVSSMAPVFTKGFPLSENITRIALYWSMNKSVEYNKIYKLSAHIKEGCNLLMKLDWKKNRKWEQNLPKTERK